MEKTTNYNKFKYVDGNREVNNSHVNNLVKSISQFNLLDKNPIIVNDDMEIIDGQHRIEAAKRLNVPIYYVVSDETNIDHVITLNAAQRKWGLIDYVNSHIARGNENYVILKEFAEEYDLPVGAAAELLWSPMTGGNSNKSNNMSSFKRGYFKVKDLEGGKLIATYVNIISKYCEPGISHQRDFIRAVAKLVRSGKVDMKEFERKLSLSSDRIKRQGSVRSYIREFEDIYNFRKIIRVNLGDI